MSEMWTSLFSSADEKLAALISLGRVVTSRVTGDLKVSFNADRLLTRREILVIDTAMKRGFPSVNVTVTVNYPALAPEVKKDVNKFKGVVIERLCLLSPACAPFLSASGCEWRLEGDLLTVALSSAQGVNFLKARRADDMIAGIMNETFGLRVRVEFAENGNEQILLERILSQRMEEEAELARQLNEEHANVQESAVVSSEAVIGQEFKGEPIAMKDIGEETGKLIVLGEVINMQLKDTKREDCKILSVTLTDYSSTMLCKGFVKPRRGKKAIPFEQQLEAIDKHIKPGKWIKLQGDYRYDEYDRRWQIMISDILPAQKPERRDKARDKRVELHMHTTMSAMDACSTPTDLIKQAADWGHKAVAVTDHGVVQAFPEAFDAAKKAGIKLIPGCEAYLIDDHPQIVQRADGRMLDETPYVVLDVETTGLNTHTDSIIEIGAVRLEGGREVSQFSMLIDPERPVPEKVTQLTGITDSMLRGQRRIGEVIGEFAAFCRGAVLVAHNAAFDTAFFRRAFESAHLPFNHPVLDTLALCRNFFPGMKNHKLGQICKELDISLENAHRAVHDARATGLVLLKTLSLLREKQEVSRLNELNECFCTDKGGDSHHIILLALNRDGMTDLNRLISESHLTYFYRTPRMPKGLIQKYRKHLLIGSACEAGELYRAIVEKKSESEIEKIAEFYDYLEIQPLANNAFMIREGMVCDEEELRDINRRILDLGRKLGKPVVATGDVHFKDPKDAIYRTIIMASRGYEDADRQAPLYFRTTDDMLAEFSYLGKEDAKYVVVEAPNQIADMVEHVPDLFMKAPDGGATFQPFWEDAEQNLKELCEKHAADIFGSPLPELVRARLDKELGSICGYGFCTLYMIAVKLVQKSLSDGYIVGSRGSVGSSFVAKLAGITEVDALPPYYACPKCKHSEFDVPKQYTCGLDLPAKKCPVCGEEMIKDGFNIPFEVFLGFKGDKVPDIDLNFSGVYQPRAHQYVKDLFGEENVFRAGTMSTVAEKTAYGYVLKYAEERGLNISQPEKERLAAGITGIKRTTGQHPAGMVVLPKGYEIYQFTAVQHPADDENSETITTHFDFTSMHDVLVKLDILGHDDPTMLRNLQDLTGIKPQAVPLHDAEVFAKIISLFSGPEVLGLTKEQLGVATGTLGVPEFGTPFVQGMLTETRPTSMEELIRISGLSHGTAVWLGNIQDILRAGKTDLKHAICTRDDIMNQLMEYGVAPKMAFTIMEYVRKGKAAKGKGGDLKPEMLEAMQQANTPEWFIEACRKIEYMFPKAHAVAYVTMALRIAYFKVFYPTAYYACFLMRNAESFDGSVMICSSDSYRSQIDAIEHMEKEEKERNDGKLTILYSLLEMSLRGISLLPIDLYESDAERFKVVNETHILPPLSSLPGLGLNAALNLASVREKGPFVSQDDMVRRKVGKSVVEILAKAGCLDQLPKTSQVSVFDLK